MIPDNWSNSNNDKSPVTQPEFHTPKTSVESNNINLLINWEDNKNILTKYIFLKICFFFKTF